MTIRIHQDEHNLSFVELSGNTYLKRHAIKARGGRWSERDKRWTLPHSEADWAREVLGAEDDTKVIIKEKPVKEKVGWPATKGEAPKTTTMSEKDFNRLENYINKQINAKAESLAPDMEKHLRADLDALAAAVKEGAVTQAEIANAELVARLDEIEETAKRNRTLEVTLNGEKLGKVKGLQHPQLDHLITALAAGLHVWISGPSGSGKTFGAKQAADALKLSFEVQGSMTMPHELLGFVDANGTYHETPFVRAFRSGGLILLDEIDAGSNEALLALNAALANGFMSLPSGEVLHAHEDFKCIGAANTFGNGATAEYVGRVRIDAAFMQRFGARLSWDYDETLERQMAGNDEWCTRVQRARYAARKNGLKVMITPRESINGAKLLATGMDEEQVAKLTYLAGLSDEQSGIIETAISGYRDATKFVEECERASAASQYVTKSGQ
jgi:hypothetical protein